MKLIDSDSDRSPRTTYVGFASYVALCSIALIAVGFGPTRAFAGREAIHAMVLAVLIGVGASLLAGIPIWFAHRKGRGGLLEVVLPMAIRMILMLGFGFVAVTLPEMPRRPLLLWLGIAYVVFLLPDTWYAKRALGSL